MALENRSPQLRKNVMSATVTVFAMPAIQTVLPAFLVSVLPATAFAKLSNGGNDPRLLIGIFLSHWFVTNLVLQRFKDVGEE